LMRTHGAEAPAFDSIVASGPNGALPHHRPGPRALEPGDLLTLDFGARVAGYHADMTRTVAVGEPAGWQRDLYDRVAQAQRARRPTSTLPRGRSSKPRATARSSATGSGTAWGWRSTRHRWSDPAPRVPWTPARPSPSSPACTCRDAAAYASRTPSWCATEGPS